jgi:glycosyltransferase involved in cell wall biosynthesis
MRLVYTGRFYEGLRTPEALLAAVARLASTERLVDELEVVLIGPGMQRYEALVRAYALDSVVQLHGPVPYEKALQAGADADVLLVLDADAPGGSMFLPSKLVDYLLWSVPILGLTPTQGATAALLRRLQCPTAAPGDVEGIASAVMDLLTAWRSNALRVSPAFDAVAAEYDIDRTAAAFAEVLARCA